MEANTEASSLYRQASENKMQTVKMMCAVKLAGMNCK
jgi:hypothetical protein